MKKPFSKYLIGILSLIMVFTVMSSTSAKGTFVNGEYETFVEALKMDNDDPSMVEGKLIKPANVVIKGNSAVVTVKTTEELNLSLIKSDGTLVPTEDLGNNIYKFTVDGIQLDSVNPSFIANMQIFVPQAPPVAQNQKFRFVFSDLVLIKADVSETPVVDEDEEQNNNNQSNNDDKSQNEKPNTSSDTTKNEGKYSILASAVKTGDNTPSMMQDRLLNPTIWEFLDGKVYAYVTFDGVLNDAKIKNTNGDFVPLKPHEGTTYKFEVDPENADTIIQIFIPEASITVDFKLVFDQSTLNNLADGEEVKQSAPGTTGNKEQTEADPSNQAPKVTNPKTGDTFPMIYIVLAFILLAGATYSFRLRRQ